MLKTKQAALPLFALCVIAMCAGLALYHYLLSQDTYDVKTVNGEQFTWQQKRNIWVVVNFFAQWCAPCIKEIPEINQFYHLTQNTIDINDVETYMVSFDQLDGKQLSAIKDKYQIELPMIISDENSRFPMPFPRALPATYIVAPDGEVVKSILGEITTNRLVEELNTAKRQFQLQRL